MSEGEGVVIPIEARDEFSSAVGRMQEAANALAQAISGVNDKMHELGDTSEKAEHDAEGGGFFGKLKEGYESLNSFKVGDLVHELEETSVAGVAVGASIFKGAEAAMEMEQQVTSLGFASQVSKESINELTEASYKMAEGSKFNAEQIQSVGARVLKMGEDNETANSVMNAAKDLAIAKNSDLTSTYLKVEQAAKAFGIEAKGMPAVMDTVAKATGDANITVDALLGPMARIAPMAKSAGLNFGEISGVMVGFEKAGLTGRLAMQGLMMSMQKATKAGVDYKTYMKDVGNDFNKMHSDQARAALLMERLGPRGAAMAQFFKQTGGDITKLGETYSNAAGTAATQAEQMEQTTKYRLELIKNHFANAGAEVADKWLPAFNGALGLVAKVPAEVIVAGTATAQGIGVVGKAIESVALTAAALKTLGMAPLFRTWALGAMMYAQSLWAVVAPLLGPAGLVIGAAAAGYGIGLLLNKLIDSVPWMRKLADATTDLGASMMDLATTGHTASGLNTEARSLNGLTQAGGALAGLTTDAGAKKSAYASVRVETNATATQREVFKELVQQIQSAGVHIDQVHFNVDKNTKAEDVEKMLRDLLKRGRSTSAAGGTNQPKR